MNTKLLATTGHDKLKRAFTRCLIIFATLALTACVDEKNTDEPMPEPEPEPEDTTVDLGKEELANCYIVQEPGVYKFKADNHFNLGEGLPVPPEINPVSAKLVWQSVKNSVSAVALDTAGDEPYIVFEVTEASGNALIGACDEDGNIVWSWHIWMPEDEVTAVPTAMGYEVMNMNLGAVKNQPGDALSYGMLYQWGRKDPFPAAATLTGDVTTVGAPLYDIENNAVAISNSSWTNSSDNNIEYSIANPTVCLSNFSYFAKSRDWLAESDDSLWGNPDGYNPDGGENRYAEKGRKTCYDPSPAGWRVAPADVFNDFTTSGGYAWTFDEFNIADINNDGKKDLNDYNYGWHFNVGNGRTLYFPAAARYDGSYAMLMGSMSGLWGSYWSNSPNSSVPGGAFCCLSFQVKGQNGEDWITVSPAGAASRADAYSVRCIRDIK